MHLLRASLTRTRVVLAVLCLTAVLAAGYLVPSEVDAVPPDGIYRVYFTTPAKTQQCGGRNYGCDGVLTYAWGCVTPYSKVTVYGCLEL